MKKLCVGFLAVVLAFSFTSCSTNESDLEIPQENLLKKAKLKRDASGAYSVEYVVADNTVSDLRTGLTSLTNEFHLSKVGFDTKDQYREDLTLNDNTLRIGFFDNETGKSVKWTIEDENITFAKGNSTNFLKTYVLATNTDGTIQLDFEVNDNIITEFVYNEDLAIHEVHLRKGTSTNKVFSRSLTIPDTGMLKLDFVNHKLLGKGTSEYVTKIPKIVYQLD
ncbi:MAG: hypothetical protein JKY44_02415 [Flavobacteriaceae bacterium]|nr:hypothetical protein [Flavobacteriaceae bacterium]